MSRDGRCLACGRQCGEDYTDSKHERHAHGIIVVNGVEVGTTLCCPHCGCHFRSVKGSGHRRTFCSRCRAVTCGKHACDTCTPWVAEFGVSQHRMV